MANEVGDIIRITAKMSYPGGDVQNVWHYKCSGTGQSANGILLAAAAAEMNTIYSTIVSGLTSGLNFDTIQVVNVTKDSLIGEATWPSLTVGGDSTSQSYATQVAALLLFGTLTLRSQGRKFVGGLAEAAIDGGGILSSSFELLLGQFAIQALSGFSSDALTLVPGNWNSVLARFVPWASAYVANRVAIQRRRRIGTGT